MVIRVVIGPVAVALPTFCTVTVMVDDCPTTNAGLGPLIEVCKSGDPSVADVVAVLLAVFVSEVTGVTVARKLTVPDVPAPMEIGRFSVRLLPLGSDPLFAFNSVTMVVPFGPFELLTSDQPAGKAA